MEGEFGGKKREKTDHKLSEHGVAGQKESNLQIHSPLINHCLIFLKQNKRKAKVLFARHRSRSPCYCHSENPSHISAADRLPPAHTIRHPAIGSCISRSRHPWGRAACPCELWPVSVSALPSGLATLSAHPAHGHSDTPLPQDRPCSSGTCQHKEHSQEGTPSTGV